MPSTALRVHPSLIVADSYVEAITGDSTSIKDEGVAARYALTTRPVAEIQQQQHDSSSTSSAAMDTSSNVAAEVLYNGASGLGQVLCSLLLFADGDGADTVTLPNGGVWSEMAGTVFAPSATSSMVVGTTASSPAAGNRDIRSFLSSLLETDYSSLSHHSPAIARRPIFKIEEETVRKHLVPHVQVSGSMLGRALSLAGGIHEMWKNVFTNKHQNGHSVLDQLAAAIAGAGTELAVADVLGRMLAYREGLGDTGTAAADSIAQAHEGQRRAWQVCAGEVLPHLNLLLLSVGGSGGIQDVVPVRMLVEACWSLLVPLSFLAAVRQNAQSLESKGVDISVVQSAVVRLIVGTFDPHRSGISNPIPSEFNVPLGTYMLLTSLAGKEFVTISAPGGTTQRVPVSPLLAIHQTNTELQLADLTVVHQMLGRTVSGAKEPWRMLLTSSVPPPSSSKNTNTTTASEMDEGVDAGSPIRRLRAQLDASIDVVDATSSPTVGSPTTANPSLGCLRDREEKKALQKLLGNSRQIRDEAATMLAPYLYSISGLGLHDLNAGSPILPNRGAGQRKSESHGAGSQSVASAEASRSRSGVGMRGRLSGGGGGLSDIGERRSRGEEVGGEEDETADKRLRFEAGSPLSVGRNSGVLGTSPNVMPSIEVGGTPLPPLDLLRRQSILGDRLPPPPPMFSAFLNNKGTTAAPPVEVTLDDGANERARVFMSSVFGDAITSSLPISAICDLERFAVNSALIALREQLHNEGADSVLSPIDHLLTYVTEENGEGRSLDLTSRVAVVALLEACMRLERHSQPDSCSTSLYLPEDVAAGSSFVSGPVVHYCRNAVQPLVDEGVNASALTPMLVLLIQSTVNAFIRSGMPRLCGMCGLLPLHSPLSYSPLSDITAPTDSNVRCGGSKGRISRAIRTAAGLDRIRDAHLGKEASSGLVAEMTAALKGVGISLADVRTSQSGRSAASLLGGTEDIPVTEGNLLTEAIQFYASRGADTEVALSRIRMQCCGSEQCSACAAFDTCRLCGEMDLVPTSTLSALSAHSLAATSSSSLTRLCELDVKEIKTRVDSLAEEAKGVDAIQGRSLLLLDTLFFTPSGESLLISPGL